jgi:hypothetical protein
LLVIALARRRSAVSVGSRRTIASAIIAWGRRRWCCPRGCAKDSERQRREGQSTDCNAADEAGAATVIATATIAAAAVKAAMRDIAAVPEEMSTTTPAGVRGGGRGREKRR